MPWHSALIGWGSFPMGDSYKTTAARALVKLRVASQTPERRREIARYAARCRWARRKKLGDLAVPKPPAIPPSK